MNRTDVIPPHGISRSLGFPRWLAAPYLVVMGTLVHGAIPYGFSLAGVRHGWVDGHLSVWNAAGTILVVAGVAVIFLCVRMHFAAAPPGPFELAPDATPRYLLTDGPYRFSRNPIYLSALTIWLGWTLFYGSFTVLAGILGFAAILGPIVVSFEERHLAARFGDRYLEYCRAVPRWLGRSRCSAALS
jgi:protein-S-isoprenylcysteine O-methyltransferase Ste14